MARPKVQYSLLPNAKIQPILETSLGLPGFERSGSPFTLSSCVVPTLSSVYTFLEISKERRGSQQEGKEQDRKDE